MRYDERKRPMHLADFQERPRTLRMWERMRNKQVYWLIECISEAMGVFIVCFAGVGATAAYFFAQFLQIPIMGSLYTIGMAYAVGVAFAVMVCTSENGGHFSPAITITFVLFKRYPVRMALRHIVAQILGGYVACLFVYLQWKTRIAEAEAALVAQGTFDAVQFTSAAPAGILALYTPPGASLGLVFVNEFLCDFVIGLVTWSVIDPTNAFVPPAVVPWAIGFSYAIAIWGYSSVGLVANGARDVGGRLAAMTIWGTTRAAGGRYAAILGLTNIPATIVSYVVYELVFADSTRVVHAGHRNVLEARRAREAYHRNMEESAPPSPSSGFEENADYKSV